MRDSLDARYWITWAGAALRRVPGTTDTANIAAALDIAERTVRHWKTRNAMPAWALRFLMQTVTGIPTYAANWEGWTFKPSPAGAVLGGPTGQEWTPADLQAFGNAYARLRALEAAQAPGSQLTWVPAAYGRIAWPGDAPPTWQQLEQALRGVLDDVLHRRAL